MFFFLTEEEHESYMLQQLQLEFRESFDLKQGYESAIYKVQKQYILRSKKTNEAPTKISIQTHNKKITEALVTEVLQILPRATPEASTPKIIDITSTETQTETITEINPNKGNQSKTTKTQTEFPSTEKQDKNTLTTFFMEDLIQTNKAQLPFNIKTEIEKLKILVTLIELVKNESYRSQITETLNIRD